MPDGWVLVCADRSAVRRAEDHFTAVVESLEAGVVVLDHTGRVESANLAAKTILDLQVGAETAGRASSLPFRVYGTDESPIHPFEHPVAVTRKTSRPSQAVIGVERRRDGRNFWLSLTATMLTSGSQASSVVATFVDITDAYRINMKLEHAATHDDLTGLPNRPLILARLDEELARPARDGAMAVLFIDLDNFKTINDLHGHIVGDAVLGVVAARLTRALPADAFVGRIGGDEFVAVIPHRAGTEADDVRAELASPITTRGTGVDGDGEHRWCRRRSRRHPKRDGHPRRRRSRDVPVQARIAVSFAGVTTTVTICRICYRSDAWCIWVVILHR